MSFWESVDYKNARKVLVIPNITNSSNIEKDSFIDVIHNHIKALDNCGEYYWNVLVPKGKVTKKLNLPNVKQIEIHIPGDMMNQRSFPSVDLIKVLKDVEYDVIYSHLPDWPQVGRYARWGTKIIGYSHWFEGSKYLPCNGVDRRDGKAKWLWLPVELMGISQMDTCYLNTQDQKNRVLDEARLMFNEDFVSKLDDILTVWNLGVPQDKIVTEVKDSKDNIIVFNHRPAAYKGYPKFIELMEEYRNQRQDFTVWIPQLSGKIPFAWIDNTKVPKHEYYQRLQNCKVGVQMKQTNYGWSISGTDCIQNGTPMIWHDSDCYHEIDPNGMFFKTKKEFFQHLDNILDDDTFRQERDNMSLQRATELSLNEDIMIKELHKQLTD
jgi:glycosyltransferase involved in cell wall biosynthesis